MLNFSAGVLMITTQVVVTFIMIYFFIKVLKNKNQD
jgi:hypothetical protein